MPDPPRADNPDREDRSDTQRIRKSLTDLLRGFAGFGGLPPVFDVLSAAELGTSLADQPVSHS